MYTLIIVSQLQTYEHNLRLFHVLHAEVFVNVPTNIAVSDYNMHMEKDVRLWIRWSVKHANGSSRY